MKKTTFLLTVCLCSMIRYSNSLTPTTVSSLSSSTPAGTSKAMSVQPSITATQPTGLSGSSSTSNAPPPTTAKAPKQYFCYDISCDGQGCLQNQTSAMPAPPTCKGESCFISSAESKTGNTTITTITAGCATTCNKNGTLFCCHQDHCNKDDSSITTPQPQRNGVNIVASTSLALLFIQLMLLTFK